MRVRTEEKRDAIVQAASEVFLELGFEGASMSQIAARVGGSKRTLYGYFPSKEELFIAFAQDTSDSYIDPMLDALTRSSGPVSQTLQRFGEDLLGFLCAPSSITIWQTIIGVSGRSDVGALFFNAGPEEGMQRMAEYLQQQMDLGLMRRGDATLAAKQLGALLEAQTLMPCLFGALKDPSPEYLRDATQRAVELFLAGYGCKNTAAA
ncbi:TetR/AcrR family transcriptional regulator [Xanthomonas hortorum pv. vitians]|uniref:TetR/AcrR family transcriptional regulator n=1 Tax=Xanthomonas hortorum pv. vitians TaxID=83224 RepID=A0A6V7EV67_9XANT|nr:TetR/AcrR family transcriptional regulator [Xanthomonas hortorum]APP85522.1 TetR family transcriptional regulator [Xanthomonas hortorum pv. gardneri]ASW44617.1 TetR family transcriptional regulator [Xanthomonas hortorum]MCC8493113.1 TetR/AcrR family transcriptional regulator [Xanthomonas hortorum pv. gardneri]MCE4280030.1 TetR/AcrR family transcriptional regulator [Xanthomonas hortorum pv. vitians]MCE4285586.1 TetR/AcrR family transcriptional regulator [Xanthomonas hortorum pv. vitians]